MNLSAEFYFYPDYSGTVYIVAVGTDGTWAWADYVYAYDCDSWYIPYGNKEKKTSLLDELKARTEAFKSGALVPKK